jgi:hypothetical protein
MQTCLNELYNEAETYGIVKPRFMNPTSHTQNDISYMQATYIQKSLLKSSASASASSSLPASASSSASLTSTLPTLTSTPETSVKPTLKVKIKPIKPIKPIKL